MARLVFVLCQPVYSCIEPSLHGLDFFLEIFFMPPQSSLQKKIAGVRSQLRSKRSSKGTSSDNFLATGGFFECNTYHITALGCLKKKER